jgi:antitoxin component HigA of HigAB toxin-antitoxin module
MAVSVSRFKDVPKTFNELNDLHALRPIQDEVDLDNAMELLDKLAVLRKPTKDQGDYLETLTTLVEKYEADNDPIETDDLSVVEILKSLMEGRDMSASDLGRVLGSRELGSVILRGERQLSKAHIMKLAKHFSVSPALFLRA